MRAEQILFLSCWSEHDYLLLIHRNNGIKHPICHFLDDDIPALVLKLVLPIGILIVHLSFTELCFL